MACAPAPAPIAPSPPPPARADVTLRDVTVRQYRGGDLRMVATAPTLELARGSNDFVAVDAGVLLKQTGVMVLAPRVTGNSTSQVATGSGGVLFLGNDGTVGRTPTATYERALGEEGGAFSDAGVTVEHPRFRLEATGFFADLSQQRVLFDQPVTRTRE
ncbi:MAG: hypothetical protein IAE78_12305 [Myxococcus sp.]|nr:hypothetical protein [Myxococcus sp.]